MDRALTHTADEIAALLRRKLSPITGNRDALVALGFERAYPQVKSGYESTVWERTIDYGYTDSGHRFLARERAFLV
jgi:hypothetical protein